MKRVDLNFKIFGVVQALIVFFGLSVSFSYNLHFGWNPLFFLLCVPALLILINSYCLYKTHKHSVYLAMVLWGLQLVKFKSDAFVYKFSVGISIDFIIHIDRFSVIFNLAAIPMLVWIVLLSQQQKRALMMERACNQVAGREKSSHSQLI